MPYSGSNSIKVSDYNLYRLLPTPTPSVYFTLQMLENTLLKNGTHVNRHPASVIVLFATSPGAADVIRSAARLQVLL